MGNKREKFIRPPPYVTSNLRVIPATGDNFDSEDFPSKTEKYDRVGFMSL